MDDKKIMEAAKFEVVKCYGSVAGNICEAMDALVAAFESVGKTLEEFAKALEFELVKAKQSERPRPSYKAPKITFLFLDKRPMVYKCRNNC